jgi:hypothetical protein
MEPIRNVFVNNFKAIGKPAWRLAGALALFVQNTPPKEGRKLKQAPLCQGPCVRPHSELRGRMRGKKQNRL